MDNDKKMSLGKKASNVALVVNISLMAIKSLAGILTKSTAVIADALNNGTDILATLAVFGGLRIAYLPPDEKHHYGHRKAESIVAKIVALLIIFTGISTGWSALKQMILRDYQKPGLLALLVLLISIVVKYFLFRYTNKVGNLIDSSSIIADSYNHRSDVLASSSALLGVAGARFGFSILDPLAGLAVSIIIFKTGFEIFFESINELMDRAPDEKTMKAINDAILSTPGVVMINQLKARKQGGELYMDLKICVDPNITVKEGHNIASKTKQNIKRAVENAADIMIHVNPCRHMDIDNSPQCKDCELSK